MALIAWLALTGCGADYDLTAVDDRTSPGGAFLAEEDHARHVRRERFRVGASEQALVSDYLFVVDDLSSMRSVLERFHEGFRSLVASDPYPAKARVAVTSTLPADPRDLTVPHPAVLDPSAARGPGFLQLVSHDGIVRAREAGGDRSRYRHDGCDAWFAPTAVNARGVACVVAHTQLSLSPVGAEAGLTAFSQLLEAQEGRALFRPGASANVIFVSDTHDPGFARIDRPARRILRDDQPTFADLQAAVLRDNDVAAFRVHAIAPATECGERWDPGHPAYFTAADASGGDILDICTSTDYAAFIRGIAQSGARVQRPVVPLGRAAAAIEDVTVDGAPVAYDLVADGRAIALRGDVPEDPVEVQVTYRWAP